MTKESATAMRELSDKQENSVDAYTRQLKAAFTSGNRVVLTRTREPIRLMEFLRDYTFTASQNYKHWDCINGWTEYVNPTGQTNNGNEDNRTPKRDMFVDFVPALYVIDAAVPPANNPQLNPGGYTSVFPDGVYVMMHPHFWIAEGPAKHPKAIQCIKQYTTRFPFTEKTLIMVVPHDFKTPVELEDDVAVIDFDLPSINERYYSIIDTMTDLFNEHFADDPGGDKASDFDFWANVLNASAGLTLKNFQDYFTDAVLKVHGSDAENLSLKTVVKQVDKIAELVNKAKTEIIKRSDVLEIMEAENMENVGGQDLLKEWIANRKNAFSKDAREFGVDAPKGAMVVGPPGTGKSLVAKAIASILEIPLIRFDVARVFNSLVGASEARIRSSLKLVDALEPCVLFIDEIDKVFHTGSGGTDSGISTRVLGTLLTWMQETKSQVFVVMSANRTHGLPPELLRKGRLDEIFSVTTPSKDELVEIIKIHFRKRGHKDLKLDYDKIARAANGYVPAEVESAIKETLLRAFNTDKPITEDMVIEELKKTVPLSVAFKEDFKAMEDWAKNNARPSSSKQRVGEEALSGMQAADSLNRRGRRKIGTSKASNSEGDDMLDVSSG